MLLIWYIVALSIFATLGVDATDLDDYVWKPDNAYGWTFMGEDTNIHGKSLTGGRSWTGYVLNYTSQRWLTDDEFTEDSEVKSLWWHYLVIVVPDDIHWTANASLYITGGTNSAGIPAAKDEDIVLAASIAMGTGTITGALFQVPNQHMKFTSDPLQINRNEGSILTFGWDHFLNDTSKPEWIGELANVKASTWAMTAMTEFVASRPDFGCNLESFTVLGASKRGWATWLTAAVDTLDRVKLIIPVVLDAINFAAVEHHEWRSYGGWSFALEDYYNSNIMVRYDTPAMTLLQENIDAFWYRDRLTMPKFIINAVLDEFQQPDDSNYWWRDMTGPKHFLMTPNADHSEATGLLEITPAMGTWINYHLRGRADEVPEFTWEISNSTGEIIATLDDKGNVFEASMWYAYSCGNNSDGINRRDFRLSSLDVPCECGVFSDGYCVNRNSWWTQVPLEVKVSAEGKRIYSSQMDTPTDGRYVAHLIEIKYKESIHPHASFPMDTGAEMLLKDTTKPKRDLTGFKIPDFPWDMPGRLVFTTQVSVWPNSFPYEDCYLDSCAGTLL